MLAQPHRPAHTADPAKVERDLVERAAAGDRVAFEQIHRIHVNRVYGLCVRLTADPGEAEILAQDTFVKAWLSLGGFAGRGGLAGWLGRIAVNLWRDRWRARDRKRRLLADVASDQAAAADRARARGQDAATVVPLLTALDLERGIARLPQGARTVFVLHEIEGYTHGDIGELLGVAAGTVKSQLHRARALLRGMLADEKEAHHGA